LFPRLLHGRVDAPRATARSRQIETDEAVDDGERAAIDQREEAARRMHHEIGHRHLAGDDEGDGLREQAEDQQCAADQLDDSGQTQ
jgi:hypothetical protein